MSQRGAEDGLCRDGFATVPFLDPSTLAEVRAVHRALGPAPGDPQTGFFPGNNCTSEDWKQEVHDAALALVGPALEATLVRYRPYFVTFLTKWPGPDGELQLHQDPTMVAHEGGARGLTLWCPLEEDVTLDRGALHLVPGSDRLTLGGWVRARGVQRSGVEEIEDAAYARFGVAPRLAPGDAVVWDHRTLHYSPANASDRPRVVLAVALRPVESVNVHVERAEDGWIHVHEVDDRYFVENPDVGEVDRPVLHRLAPQQPPITGVDELVRVLSTDEVAIA